MIRRLLREPLAHFFLIGLGLFVLFDVVGGGRGAGGRTIVVDDAVVADLVQRYAAAWQRPPTPQELAGLVENWVRDEVAYREGLALRLDRDDSVIRRRVRQKVDVLAEEARRLEAPTDAELEAWLRANPARYAEPPALSFEQAMIDPGRHAAGLDEALAHASARVEAGEDPAAVSDARLLPAQVRDLPADLVARQFGEAFANAIRDLPVGTWHGPLRSGYGLHFVKLTGRTPGRVPALDDVRTAVARDVEKERREQAAAAFYAALRAKFDVRIEADLTQPRPTE